MAGALGDLQDDIIAVVHARTVAVDDRLDAIHVIKNARKVLRALDKAHAMAETFIGSAGEFTTLRKGDSLMS